jgi:hypothetical protein
MKKIHLVIIAQLKKGWNRFYRVHFSFNFLWCGKEVKGLH